jgi:hypothetical protein
VSAGIICYYAAKGLYYDFFRTANEKPSVVLTSQPRAGLYALYSDNRIRFDDGVVFDCEDELAGREAMKQMDMAACLAPRECTWRDKERFARLGLGYEVIKDAYISREEVGLPPNKKPASGAVKKRFSE